MHETQACTKGVLACSQAHLLTEKTYEPLGLTSQSVDIPLCDANQMKFQISQITRAKVQSRISDYTAELTFLVIDKVSQSVPLEDIEFDNLDLPRDIPLADPTFDRSSDVHGFIGAQLIWDLHHEGRVNIVDQNMQLRNTELGWIVMQIRLYI